MMKEGDLIPAKTFDRIRQADLVEYAHASGDHNPIHLSEEVARRMGLPGVIAHGMLIASYIGAVAEEYARSAAQSEAEEEPSGAPGLRPSPRFPRCIHCATRFKNMTLLGEQLTVRGAVKSVVDGVATLELEARNEAAELKTTAVYRFRLA